MGICQAVHSAQQAVSSVQSFELSKLRSSSYGSCRDAQTEALKPRHLAAADAVMQSDCSH